MSKIRFKTFSGSFSRYWNKNLIYFFFKIFFCQKMFKNEISTHNPWIPMISWPFEIVQPLFARKFYLYINTYRISTATMITKPRRDTLNNSTPGSKWLSAFLCSLAINVDIDKTCGRSCPPHFVWGKISFNWWFGYGSILIDTFLVGWTSVYQLFWCELQGYKILTHCHLKKIGCVDVAIWVGKKTRSTNGCRRFSSLMPKYGILKLPGLFLREYVKLSKHVFKSQRFPLTPSCEVYGKYPLVI